MKNLQKGYFVPLIIIISMFVVCGGIYIYINKIGLNQPTDRSEKNTIKIPVVNNLYESNSRDRYEPYKYPKNILVDNSSTFSTQISAYGAAHEVWIAPKEWTGEGSISAYGESVNLYTKYTYFTKYRPYIYYYKTSGCEKCATEAAADYFPDAMQKWNSKFNTSGLSPITVPSGLKINQISPTLITYTLPNEGGLSIKGVAYYGLRGDSQSDLGYVSARFALPQDQSDLSDFIMKMFIERMDLK